MSLVLRVREVRGLATVFLGSTVAQPCKGRAARRSLRPLSPLTQTERCSQGGFDGDGIGNSSDELPRQSRVSGSQQQQTSQNADGEK